MNSQLSSFLVQIKEIVGFEEELGCLVSVRFRRGAFTAEVLNRGH